MKKMISVILSAMLILSLNVYAEETVGKTSKYAEDTELLKKLGIISYMDGVEDENAVVTRAEFTASVVELAYKDARSDPGESGFSDVAPDPEYAAAIEFARATGLVSGTSQNKFEPNSAITGSQAIKILISAMGYTKLAEGAGGYPSGYYSTAKALDILDGVEINNEGALTAGVFAKMIVNAGFAELAEKRYTADGTSYVAGTGSSLFESVHNICKGEGVLFGNEYTSITDAGGVGESLVTIGDFTGRSYGDIKAEEYLGCNVEYYYHTGGSSRDVVIYLAEKNNNITKIDLKEVCGFDNGQLEYHKTSESLSKRKKYIPLDASVIYNGRLINKYDESDFVGKTGDLKLIDNDEDGTIDVVNIVSYANFVINAIDEHDSLMYDKTDGTNTLDFSDEQFVNAIVIWDSEAKRVKLDELRVNDVLTMAKSKDGGYIRALLSRKQVSGVVTRITVDNKVYINIDDEKYEVEGKCYEKFKTSFDVGSNVTAFIDALGRIAYIKTTGADASFATIIKCVNNLDNSGHGALKLTEASGKISIYNLADRFCVDGETYKNTPNVPDNVRNSRVIRFKLNKNNEINWIDTPVVTTESGGSIYKLAELNNRKYISNSKSFMGILQMNTDMLIFNVPSDTANQTDDDYSIGASSNFLNGERYTGTAYAVKDNALVADVILIEDGSNSQLTYTSPVGLIKSSYLSVDEDGNRVNELELVRPNSNSEFVQISPDGNAFESSGADVGDIIKYETNSNGQINAMEVIFYAKTKTLNHNLEAGRNTPLTGLGLYYDAQRLTYFAKVENREGNVIEVAIDDQIIDNPKSAIKDKQMFFDLSSCASRIVTVDLSESERVGKVRIGDVNTIADTVHFGEGSQAFFYTVYGVPQMFVIYK